MSRRKRRTVYLREVDEVELFAILDALVEAAKTQRRGAKVSLTDITRQIVFAGATDATLLRRLGLPPPRPRA